MKNKRSQSEANDLFERQLQNFEKFDVYNIFEVEFFANLLKQYIKDAQQGMEFRYDEAKIKYEAELRKNLEEAVDMEEAYLWCLATNENYKKTINKLDDEIKQKIQESFYSFGKTSIGNLFVYIIIYKVRFSNLDESLEKIISDMKSKRNELVELIKPSIINAFITGEEYSLKRKLPKNFNRAVELLRYNVSAGFVPYEILCKKECIEYIKKHKSEFIEKVISNIPEGEKREIFDMYFGVTKNAKSFPKIAKKMGKDISEVTEVFKDTAKSLKAKLK